MKTKEEVDALKKDWEKDPVWDIEDTEGFEEYRLELYIYRIYKKHIWKEYEIDRLEKRSEKLGIPGKIELVRYIETLENRIKDLAERIVNDE